MALDKNKLEYQIKVNTGEAKRDIEGLTYTTEKLRDSAGKFATKEQVELYNSLQRTRRELDKQAESGKDVEKEYKKLEKQAEDLGLVSSSTGKNMGEVSSSFDKIGGSASTILASLDNLTDLLDKFSDPERIKRMSNILLILSKVASFKGMDAVSNGLGSASQALDKYNVALAENGTLLEQASKKVETYATGIRTIDSTLNAAGTILETFVIGVGSASLALSALNSNAIPKTIKVIEDLSPALKVTFKSMKTVTSALNEFGSLAGGLSVDAFSSGILSIGRSSDVAIPALQRLISTFGTVSSTTMTAFQMVKAGNIGFFDTVKRGYPLVISALKEMGIAFGSFFKSLYVAFQSGGFSKLFGEFSVDLKQAFSFSGMDKAGSVAKNSLSDIGNAFKSAGGIITSIAKEVPSSIGKVVSGVSSLPQATKDFYNFSKTVLSTHVGPSLLVAAEAAQFLNTGLVGLGAVLMNSDNAFAKFSGTLLLVGGILLGGFAYAVKVALGYLGSLITAVGDTLIGAMNEFEKKFQKAQVSTTNFAFTLAGLNREFGDSAGTVESWSKVIGELSDNTLVARSDAEKMATEIASVGHGLGLTKTQMEDFLRVIPNYIKAGDDAFDVTVSFLQALGGAPQGVLKYAVHLSDASVEHSKLAKQIGISMGTLSEEQKVQARFNALMEQASPILGRAAEQLNTVAGAQQFLAKSVDVVQQRMGSQNSLVAAMNVAFAKMVTVATYLPKPFWDFLGVIQDVLGVTAKLVGTFISWAFPIAAIVALFKVLSVVLATNATIQLLLSKVLTSASVSLGGQAVAVTSLTTLWAGFGAVVQGVVITSFTSLVASLKAAALGVWSLTAAMFANPLFWKAALIVGAVVAVYQAFKRIEVETKLFSDSLTTLIAPFRALIESFGDARDAGGRFSSAMGMLLRKPIDLAVIAITAIISGFYSLSAAIAYTLNLLTFGQFEIFSKTVDDANEKIMRMSGAMNNATEDLFRFSATASADPFSDLSSGAQEAQDKLKGLSKELISATEKRLIFAQAEGKRAEVLLLTKQLTEERMALAKDVEEKKNLAKELLRADAELQQFPREAIQDAHASWVQIKVATLEDMKDLASIRQAGALKAKEALKPLQEKLAEIQLLPKTTDTQKAAIEIQRLMADTQSSINRDTTKKLEELKLSRIQNEIDTKLEIAKMRGDELKQIELNAEKQITAFAGGAKAKGIAAQQVKEMTDLILAAKDKQVTELATKNETERLAAVSSYAQLVNDQTLLARSGYDKQLLDYKKMLDEKKISDAQYQEAKAKLEQQKALGEAKGAGAAAGNFGQEGVTQAISQVGAFMQGFSDMLMGPIAAVQGVVSIAQGLVDAIPNLLSSITNLVVSLVELPTKILDGVLALAKAIPRLVSEFIPRLLEAIPDIIFSILEMLYVAIPDAFMKLFQRIPDIITAIIEKIPQVTAYLVTGIITSLPKIALSLINALINGIPKIIVALVEAIPVIINALIQGLVDGVMMIGEMIMSIFTGGSFFKNFGKNVADSVGTALKAVTGVAGNLFSVENLTNGPVADAANSATQKLLSAGRTIKNWLGMAWEGMKQAGRWLDQNIWQPAWEGMKAAGRWLDSNIIQPVWGAISGLGQAIWFGLTEAVKGGAALFSQIGTWIWDGLKAGFDGIGNLFSKLFSFDGKGMGTVERFIGMDFPWVNFAQGGLVPGRASIPGDSLKNDKVPALLSPGEVVLPRSVLGDEAFRKMVMAKLAGQEIPQFGLGGMLKSAGSAIVSGASSMGDVISSGAGAVGDVLSGAADFLIPDWIQDLYNSITKFISGIDMVELVKNPSKALMDAIRGAVDVFAPYFKEMIKPTGFATGGLVGNPSDTVPAMLTPGEFVINRSAVNALGVPTLQTLNQGRLPQTGGGGSGTQNVEINLTINTTNGIDVQTVKNRVLPVIMEELRRASLDGRRVLSPTGVR